ncbi:MAG: hypothetical protein LQ348_006634 [Seirophora lacunosa]|nr:MAG: hypothetical protein LQ344_005167 [Seirophora lacunosa]KAI4173209.1 MAG: hypothetical protein LQ348_006634 [Seirophora lacunosa]
MNCPSRTDEDDQGNGWNQSPPGLSADLTTRADLNGIANLRTHRDVETSIAGPSQVDGLIELQEWKGPSREGKGSEDLADSTRSASYPTAIPQQRHHASRYSLPRVVRHMAKTLSKFCKFIGPGFMVAVAYIDPGNYATDVAAGAAEEFKLLFIVMMSNVFAILLQSLAVRLGTVTGLNLAENCRAHLPRWLNLVLYVLAEGAIIATDIAEVIGSAIALNLLLKIPLVAGCALTIVDVLIILIFYSPDGSMRRLRAFECFVMLLVLGVVICFCIQLSYIRDTEVGDVFKGYLPSSAVVQGEGIYLSCGILGATVMPHSLYLGSGVVQSRLRHFDVMAGNITASESTTSDASEKTIYRPSLSAIQSCLTHSTVEVALSLFTFALFVNSAILIVAGASLYSNPEAGTADLFGIYALLTRTLAPAAGTIFALALLLSGTSAGIVCTIAGQMLSEGALNWSIAPWLRRLLTRSMSIVPSIVIAGAVGKEGLSAALTGTQVALSVALPFVSAPLIYFTCREKYMVIDGTQSQQDDDDVQSVEARVSMENHWIVSIFAVLVWLVIVVMNFALLVLVGLGKASH